jgi:hypothetical protein
LVTSSDIENQKLVLMLDAVSAHTDCLIQIFKEQGLKLYPSLGCFASQTSRALRRADGVAL